MRTSRWIGGLAAAALLLTVAACGSSSKSATTKDTTATTVKPTTVTVTMADFSFSVSGKLTQGGSIELRNEGSEMHMMGVGKLKAGATLDQVKAAMAKADPKSENDPTEPYIEKPDIGWPGGIVTPGHSVIVSADNLQPGTYALICFMPGEGTGKPHFASGMVNELDVVAGSATPQKADATYTVTVGKPIEGPATLTAGKHTITITGNGDISKQEPQLVKAKSADQTTNQINDEINKIVGDVFGGDKPPPKGTGTSLAVYLPFNGFDMDAAKTVTFTYDFTPGTYYLAAPDTDNDTGPSKVPTELIKIVVS